MNGTLKATVFACTISLSKHVTKEHHHDAIALFCWKAFSSLAISVLSVLCFLTAYFVNLLIMLVHVFKLTF